MNKHAQSTIEYALIAVLVILGIVVMGPYVLRSVNAHFKLWDEGVQDSTQENIVQAPVADVPPINVNCSCPTLPGSCNTTNCGIGYREYDYNCTPQGCNHASNSSYCKVDGSCCGLPVNLNCGSYPLPTDASGNINLSAETTPQPPTPGNCYYGQEITGTTCGSSSSIQCVPKSNCPMPACLGSVSQSNIQACPGSPGTPGEPAIAQNYGMTFVGDQSSCTAGTPCQYSCAAGYILQNGVCVLPPPPPCTIINIPADNNHRSWLASTDDASYLCLNNGFHYLISYQTGGCSYYIVLVHHSSGNAGPGVDLCPSGNCTADCNCPGGNPSYSCAAPVCTASGCNTGFSEDLCQSGSGLIYYNGVTYGHCALIDQVTCGNVPNCAIPSS